jgi:RNA polymerase sigma-70 factor (ECF subfamily)
MHFEEAVRADAARLHRLARRLTDSSHDAEDLLQDTYLLAWRSWERSGPPDRVTPWLVTICLNQARSRRRRTSSLPLTPEDVGAVLDADVVRQVTAGDVEDLVLGNLDTGRVRAALRRLPYAQRESLVLMDLCGLTAAESAGILDVPRGTVLSRVHRGRQALALLLIQTQEVS